MSTPGWYPDPTDRGRLRWWDGHQWTDRTMGDGATPASTGRRLRPVSDWFSHLFGLAVGDAGPLFSLIAVTQIPLSIIGAFLAYRAFDDASFTLGTDDVELVGFDVPSLLGATIVSAVGMIWFASVAQRHLLDRARGHTPMWSESLREGSIAATRLFGWMLVVGVVWFGALALPAVAIAVAGPIGALLAIPVAVVVVLGLAVPAQFLPAAVQRDGYAPRFCLETLRGLVGPIVGRTVLAVLVGIAALLATGILTSVLTAIAGIGAVEVVELDDNVQFVDLSEVFPNVGAAVVASMIGALQNGLVQSLHLAGTTSMVIDSHPDLSPADDGSPTR